MSQRNTTGGTPPIKPLGGNATPSNNFGGYIPMAERQMAKVEKAITPPSTLPPIKTPYFATKKGIAENTIKGIPSVIGGAAKATGGFLKEVGQSMARNIGSAGLSLSAPSPSKVADSSKSSDFKSFFGQALFETVFGKDAEIKPIETRITEAEPKVQEWGAELEKISENPELNARERFITKGLAKLAKNDPRSLSFLGIMGSVGFDLTPFGGLEKGAYKAITKVKTIGEALTLGRKMGIADDLLEQFAKDAIKVTKDADAKILLESIANLQKTTKPAVKAGEETLGQYIPMAERNVDNAVGAVDDLKKPITEAKVGETTITPSLADNSLPVAKTTDELATKGGVVDDFTGNLRIVADNIKEKAATKDEFLRQIDEGLKNPNLSKREGVEKVVDEIKAKGLTLDEFHDIAIGKGVNRETLERASKIADDVTPAPISSSGENAMAKDFATSGHDLDRAIEAGDMPVEKVYKNKAGELTPDYTQHVVSDLAGKLDEYKPGFGAEFKKVVDIKNATPNSLDNQAVEFLKKNTTQELKISDQGGILGKPGLKKVNLAPESPSKITKTEPTLLKERLKNQATGAKAGEKAGIKTGRAEAENIATTKIEKAVRKEELKSLKGGIKLREAKDKIINKLKVASEATQEIKNDVVQFVKKNLDPEDRGKALVMVRDAKTQRDLTKAFARVNRWAEDAEKKAIRNEILKTQKQIMDSPSVAVDYKAKIKELMGDFELKGHREETLERLKKTQEFLEAEAKKGNDVEMPRRVLKSLELLNRTPFDEITTSQLTGLQAEIELLEELGRTKWKTIENIWDIQKTKIIDEVKLQGAKPINNIELIKPEIGERLTITQKFRNLIYTTQNQAARIDKAISPMDTIFDLLDGGKGTYAGANFKFFKGQVDAGYGKYISRKEAIQEPVIELATKHKLADTNFERMGVVAAREQDKGMEKLVASGFTESQVNAVKLTNEEQEVLNLMRKTFDSQFPEIQDTMRRVYNQPVEKVKNYFSFMTDWKAMDDAEVFQRFGSQLPEQYGAPRKNVEAGFTKSRVGGDQKIKINALDVFLQHTDNTSYLLEVGETSKMLGEVANSPEYAEMVGEVGQLMVKEWLDVVARKGGAAGASTIPVLDTLRKNVGAGILGLKLSTIAIQPTALIDGMGFIGAKYGTKGVSNFATSSEWRKFIGNMPEISDRMGGEFALRELTDDNWLQEIQRKGFIPMQKLDQMTSGAIASGAYEKKMIELGKVIDFTKYDDEALAYAQLAVRRTQSSGAFKDVPLAVSRGALTGNRSLDRAMLQFQNFLLTRWSRIRHDAIRAGINTKDPKKAIPIFTAIIMSAIAASGIRLGVNKVQDFITGREDKDSVAEDLQKGFMYEMTGNVPFLGTAVSMAMYDGEMFPILDAPKGIISGLNRVITSESEGAKLRGMTEFAGSLGAMIGIPGSAQTETLLRGILQDDKAEPKTKAPKLPAGLPALPSLKKVLPTPPGLPKLPTL